MHEIDTWSQGIHVKLKTFHTIIVDLKTPFGHGSSQLYSSSIPSMSGKRKGYLTYLDITATIAIEEQDEQANVDETYGICRRDCDWRLF